jgi:hypothetical protein
MNAGHYTGAVGARPPTPLRSSSQIRLNRCEKNIHFAVAAIIAAC